MLKQKAQKRMSCRRELLCISWQKKMNQIEDCVQCGLCSSRCPYELDTPALLRRNLADYRAVLAGEASVQEHVHLKH